MGEPDKTVIVTGANSGLGFECARSILRADDGWHVVVAGRSPERNREAVGRLAAPAGSGLSTRTLDLASLGSVRRFAAEFPAHGLPPLRALVCNAGVQHVGPTQRTGDGFEATFGVNHLGHFLLRRVCVRSGPHAGDRAGPRRRPGRPVRMVLTGVAPALVHPAVIRQCPPPRGIRASPGPAGARPGPGGRERA